VGSSADHRRNDAAPARTHVTINSHKLHLHVATRFVYTTEITNRRAEIPFRISRPRMFFVRWDEQRTHRDQHDDDDDDDDSRYLFMEGINDCGIKVSRSRE
jgi:hypothetical protein